MEQLILLVKYQTKPNKRKDLVSKFFVHVPEIS
mgnify:CR=1 FL=1